MTSWEDTLRSWARPASETEDEKRDRTERMIRDAVRTVFAPTDVDIYAKGSYANNTNVRADSDVDIAVEFTNIVYVDSDDGRTPAQLGYGPSAFNYLPSKFKTDVEDALVANFGRTAVTRGGKALHVREKTSRLSADVVPCFTYKRHYSVYADLLSQQPRVGVKLFPDAGGEIINWPRQQAENGNRKNSETGRRYKRIVRILKHLENELVARRRCAVVPSYLIECLVYNVENMRICDLIALFGDGYHRCVRNVVQDAYQMVQNDHLAGKMVEVNGIKPLFALGQPWTRQQALGFLELAWGELDLAQVA